MQAIKQRTSRLRPWLLQDLFGGQTIGGPKSSNRTSVFAAALLALVLTTLSLARQGFHNAFDTIAGEDGSVFFHEATLRSVPDQFTHVYAGYLHAGPRFLAFLSTLVPLAWAAAVSTVGAAIFTALLAATVYIASGAHLRSHWARVAVASGLILLPILRVENVNDAMNLQWSLLYTTFWVLLWRPVGRLQSAAAILVLLFMTLSQPLSAVFLPLLVLRIAVLRDRQSLMFGAIMAFGWVVQAIAVVRQSKRDTFAGALTNDQVLHGYTYDTFHAVFPSASLLSDGSVSRWILLGLVAVCLVFAVVISRGKRLALPAAALIMSVLLYLGPVVGGSEVAPRYIVAPALLILVALVAVLDLVDEKILHASMALALTAVLAIGWVADFSVSSFRNNGATWSSEVAWAHQVCEGKADNVKVKLWTVPPPWFVDLQCKYVNSH